MLYSGKGMLEYGNVQVRPSQRQRVQLAQLRQDGWVSKLGAAVAVACKVLRCCFHTCRQYLQSWPRLGQRANSHS